MEGENTTLAEEAQALIELVTRTDNPDRGMAFASLQLPNDANDLSKLKASQQAKDLYDQMVSADKYVRTSAIPQRLANWRAKLWSAGFAVKHPHPVIRRAYEKFGQRIGLPLLVQQGMHHLSSMNNCCLIWRQNKISYSVEYVEFYNPGNTRIDRIGQRLWLRPTDDFVKAVNLARNLPEKLQEYINSHKKGSSIAKWIKAVIDPQEFTSLHDGGQYTGMIPLSKADGEYWLLMGGDGGKDQEAYSPVTLLSIFADIDLVDMLASGDWATAYMMKNATELIQAGESITGGNLSGSTKNWAQDADLAKLEAEFNKAGRARRVYANHTLKISYSFPDPEIFNAEKYRTVIDRICWAFGIGAYVILGANPYGGSYSSNSWNIASIRTEAIQKREVMSTHLEKFFLHSTVMSDVFKGNRIIHVNDFVKEITKRRILSIDVEFVSPESAMGGVVEYSKDGFVTSTEYQINNIQGDTNTFVLDGQLPKNAKPEELRLALPYKVAMELYGPPTTKYNVRVLKEDRQNLAELQFLITQGPLSNKDLMEALGFDFEDTVDQKKREWRLRPYLIPLWETSQGLLDDIIEGLEDLERTEEDGDGAITAKPGKPGRPETREEGEGTTKDQPRPS